MAHEFKSPAGKKVVINAAPFKDVMALKSAIGKEISSSNIDIDFKGAESLFEKDFNPADIAKLLLLVDSSEKIFDCLFVCLSRCTYNGEKITEATFDDEDAREDYYPIALACLKENLFPFFKALLSKLSPLMAQMAGQGKAQDAILK